MTEGNEKGSDTIPVVRRKRRSTRLAEGTGRQWLYSLEEDQFLALKAFFKDGERTLTFPEFVHAVRQVLHETLSRLPVREVESQLRVVFDEISKVNAGGLAWQALTGYLIDCRLREHKRIDEEECPFRYNFLEEMELVETGDVASRIVYFPALKKVLALSKNGVAKFIAGEGYPTVEKTFEATQYPLSTDFNPMTNTLLVSSGMSKFHLYQCNTVSGTSRMGRIFLKKEIALETSQTVVKWGPSYDRLYCGSRTGDLTIWTYKNASQGLEWSQMIRNTLKVGAKETELRIARRMPRIHKDSIMDMLILSDGRQLATCSLDGTVLIQDIAREEIINHRSNDHGVRSLAYSNEYKLMFSCGFGYHINFWIPFQGNIPVHRLEDEIRPHTAALLSVQLIPESSYLLACDAKGMVKIWDIRTFRQIQCFTVPPAGERNADEVIGSYQYIPTSQHLIFNSTNHSYVYGYQGLQEENEQLHSEDYPATLCCYHPHAQVIITIGGCDMKIWNAQAGILQTVFEDVVDAEIVTLAVRARDSSILVGLCNGSVLALNVTTGIILERYVRTNNDKSEIIGISALRSKRVVAGTSKGTIILWVPSSEDSEEILPAKVYDFGRDLISFLVCDGLSLLSTGDAHGYLQLHTIDGKNIQHLETSHLPDCEITHMTALAPIPVLVVSDNVGFIHMLGLIPYTHRNESLASFKNTNKTGDSIFDGDQGAAKVTRMTTALDAHGPIPHILITGDEDGYVRIWDLWPVIEQSGVGSCYDSSIGKYSSPPSSPNVEPSPLWARMVTMLSSWTAHQEAILSLTYVIGTKTLITAGTDQRVIIWGFTKGFVQHKIGVIRQSLPNHGYKFAMRTEADLSKITLGPDTSAVQIPTTSVALGHYNPTDPAPCISLNASPNASPRIETEAGGKLSFRAPKTRHPRRRMSLTSTETLDGAPAPSLGMGTKWQSEFMIARRSSLTGTESPRSECMETVAPLLRATSLRQRGEKSGRSRSSSPLGKGFYSPVSSRAGSLDLTAIQPLGDHSFNNPVPNANSNLKKKTRYSSDVHSRDSVHSQDTTDTMSSRPGPSSGPRSRFAIGYIKESNDSAGDPFVPRPTGQQPSGGRERIPKGKWRAAKKAATPIDVNLAQKLNRKYNTVDSKTPIYKPPSANPHNTVGKMSRGVGGGMSAVVVTLPDNENNPPLSIDDLPGPLITSMNKDKDCDAFPFSGLLASQPADQMPTKKRPEHKPAHQKPKARVSSPKARVSSPKASGAVVDPRSSTQRHLASKPQSPSKAPTQKRRPVQQTPELESCPQSPIPHGNGSPSLRFGKHHRWGEMDNSSGMAPQMSIPFDHITFHSTAWAPSPPESPRGNTTDTEIRAKHPQIAAPKTRKISNPSSQTKGRNGKESTPNSKPSFSSPSTPSSLPKNSTKPKPDYSSTTSDTFPKSTPPTPMSITPSLEYERPLQKKDLKQRVTSGASVKATPQVMQGAKNTVPGIASTATAVKMRNQLNKSAGQNNQDAGRLVAKLRTQMGYQSSGEHEASNGHIPLPMSVMVSNGKRELVVTAFGVSKLG